MESISFVISLLAPVAFVFALIAVAHVRTVNEKLTELEADLQSLKEELTTVRDQFGQGNATS